MQHLRKKGILCDYKVISVFDVKKPSSSKTTTIFSYIQSTPLDCAYSRRHFNLPIYSIAHIAAMSSSQGQQQQSSGGSRPTGATGGGYYRHPCRNWQQEGHPKDYNFIDQNDQLCAHCLVGLSLHTVQLPANCRTSAHPAAVESISITLLKHRVGKFLETGVHLHGFTVVITLSAAWHSRRCTV